jgi:uncharacterized coiled-coil protein SlyX
MDTEQPVGFANFVDIVVTDELHIPPTHQLLAVVSDSHAQTCYDTVPDPSPNAYQGQTITVEKNVPVTRTQLILGRRPDDVLKEWQTNKDEAIKASKALEKLIEELKEEIEKLKKAQIFDAQSLESCNDQLTARTQTIDTLQGDIEALNSKLHESDLYMEKAMKHFGDRAWKEFEKEMENVEG